MGIKKKNYPQVFLEEYKHKMKKTKIRKFINTELESESESESKSDAKLMATLESTPDSNSESHFTLNLRVLTYINNAS